MTYCMILSYDGTDFNGWQAQGKQELRTVQEVVEEAAKKLFHTPVRLTASGRTDAGVHARYQPCSFQVETAIPAERIADAINPFLPPDVKAVKSYAEREDFCACRSAKKKTYVYSVYLAERDDPLLERYAVRVGSELSLSRMEQAAALLEGEHDFKAFCASNSSIKTTVRKIYRISIQKESTMSGDVLRFYVTGNGFLYNMVRTLVGTLLDISFGRRTIDELERAIGEGDRSLVGRTMPAKGLCLYSVEYV